MKSLLFLALTLLSAGAATQPVATVAGTTTQTRNGLVGPWKLVSLEEQSADGQDHHVDCSGLFVFTENGRASVQVMYRTARNGSAYSKGGYEASFGSYHVDSSSTFTFHIEGSIVRTLIGKGLKRTYEITGDRLTVKSTDPNEHWKVIWERY